MKSVDALRKWANGLCGIWIDPNDHSIIVTTCDDMPPSIDCVNLREHVNEILDGIDREVEERYTPLPVDANGVPWHVGDMTENGNVVNGMTIDFHGWHFTGTRNDIDPAIHRHYVPKPTVEDVLREFVDALDIDRCEDFNATIAEFAAKLTLRGDE